MADADALARRRARVAELAAVLGPPPPEPPAIAEDAALEVVVWGDAVDAELERLDARLVGFGYGPAREHRNGDRTYTSAEVGLPDLTLHPDGLMDVAFTSGGSFYGLGGTFPMGRNKTSLHRQRLVEALQPELTAWRDALCAAAFQPRLTEQIPDALDGIWREGIGFDGAPLAEPADRRAELLDYWATRTCTPEGDQVRGVVARYLDLEVQASQWPITAEELTAANGRRSCDAQLVLPGLGQP